MNVLIQDILWNNVIFIFFFFFFIFLYNFKTFFCIQQVENPLRSMVEVLTKFILEEWGLCSAIIAKSNSLSKSPQKPSDKNGNFFL